MLYQPNRVMCDITESHNNSINKSLMNCNSK